MSTTYVGAAGDGSEFSSDNALYVEKKSQVISQGFKASFLLAALLCVLPLARSQNAKLTFEHFSIDQGMSGSDVHCIYQDSIGYLWFGTGEGIDRFDGYSFTSYRPDPENPASLVNAFVEILCEDRAGNIWVGTLRGLDKLDRATGRFSHYLLHPEGSGTKWSNSVKSIHEDRDGLLWIGTDDGLNVFDRSNGKFTCFRDDSTYPGDSGYNSIRSICEDREGLLWIGTDRGLNRFDKKSGKFIHYWHDFNQMNRFDNWIHAIYEDGSGILWLGGGAGLVSFDQRAGTFTQYGHDPKDPRSLSGNDVSSISENKAGQLWVGTYNHGLNVFDKKSKSFTRFVHNEKDPGSLSSNGIRSVCCERSGTIWVSTPDKGVNKLNRAKPPFTSYPYDVQAPNTIFPQAFGDNTDRIWIHATNEWKKFDPKTETFLRQPLHKSFYPLLDDREGNLWIGKESGGLYKSDHHGQVTGFHDSSGLKFRRVSNCLIESRDGRFWMGTDDGGIYAVDPDAHSVIHLQEIGSDVISIYEDASGILWFGTWDVGLLCYDPERKTTVRYSYDPRNPASPNSNLISTVFEDRTHTLWVGGQHGLDRFDRAAGTFTHFTVKDGLPIDGVVEILEDDHGDLWLGTFKGISKFDPKKIRFKNYDVSDGLASNAICTQSGCTTTNGEMYFGGGGLTRFHPDSIRDNPYVPPIVVTQFRLFEKPTLLSNEMNLSYRDNYISFEFAALSYISPQRNQYAYKMEGIDPDWVNSGTRRYAGYPNMEPGEYVFRVKGSNNDGVWNEEGASVRITVTSPWWKTTWAYLLYGLVAIGALYGIRRFQIGRLLARHKLEMTQVEARTLREEDRMKSRFFANISHEFRTPLTLILGPTEELQAVQPDESSREKLSMVHRNAQRLLRLINQLLDLSKIDAGGMKLQAAPGDIVPFVKGIAQSFQSSADGRNVALNVQAEKKEIELYFDQDKMEKILTNLLSNAFKFTPVGGTVTVCIQTSSPEPSGSLEIIVGDTGIGIPKAELPHIFDRFYQVDASQTREQEGTGIGLALTKELVELHHGTISVRSVVGKGTEFLIRIPLGSAHLTADEIIAPRTEIGERTSAQWEVHVQSAPVDAGVQTPDGTRPIVLVVEDNVDVRAYVRQYLVPSYQVLEAHDGKEGVEKARETIPDLIISDVMMPKMDGYELCRTLKLDEKTSHVPIILLTAKAGQENKIEGLETGADDYLTKPFDAKELLVRVKNLMDLRRKLKERFKASVPLKPGEIAVTSMDDVFLNKVMAAVEQHIGDEDFHIEELGAMVGMSRVQLHRKLSALTNQGPGEFIRYIRLHRALELLQKDAGTISEIAYKVGFSDPSYFSKCFHKQFGKVPTDARKSSLKADNSTKTTGNRS